MGERDKIRLEIVTPDKEVFHNMVESFTVPAVMGSTGILYNHAPLLTVLEPGVLTYRMDGKEGCLAISRGFLEMRDNEAEILVDSAEKPEDIDVERAKASEQRARERLAQPRTSEIDRDRAEASLARALARQKAAAGK